MPKLRDYFFSDLESTFLNLDEFAQTHTIDGNEVSMIIDSDTFDSRNKNQTETYINGVYESNLILYIKSTDFEKPVIGERIRLDDEYYYVTSSSVDHELLKIVITSNES